MTKGTIAYHFYENVSKAKYTFTTTEFDIHQLKVAMKDNAPAFLTVLDGDPIKFDPKNQYGCQLTVTIAGNEYITNKRGEDLYRQLFPTALDFTYVGIIVPYAHVQSHHDGSLTVTVPAENEEITVIGKNARRLRAYADTGWINKSHFNRLKHEDIF